MICVVELKSISMEKHIWVQIMLSIGLVVILGVLYRLYKGLVAEPRRLLRVLKQQGIGGPPPILLLGNILELKNSMKNSTGDAGAPASHNCGAHLFSVFEGWRRQYGDIFSFSLGNKPILLVNKYDVAKEVTTCTSLDLGRPTYLAKDLEPMLGNGIIASNGNFWAYQRKVLAPELFNHKVKAMTDLIQQSTLKLIDSWKGIIDAQGGIKADIKVDDYLRKFSGDVISRACFGSNYLEGEQFFENLRALEHIAGKLGFSMGVPGRRYIPTKNNRREWKLQRDLGEMIMKLVKQKTEAAAAAANIGEKNMLQMIVEGARDGNLNENEIKKFTIDNCKNIYLAGYETTAVAASWCLMLLGANPEWQDRVREEVVQVCKGQLPNYESFTQMKQLTMVINESLRLYPPVTVLSREALNELEFANIRIPKGVCLWVLVTTLHTDPDIWGPDSYEFKPERFANGATGACKLPHLFMPFGVGPRICLGLNLAMLELKILISHILSNFSLSTSPNYVHTPLLNTVLEPKYGVDLLIQNLPH